MDKTPGIFVTSSLINAMVNAVTKASKKLLRDFGEVPHLNVSQKSAHDFLTSSDIAAEKILMKELSDFRPEYSILSEESGFHDNGSECCWIIDPLDGTVNFIHGVMCWCISIALKKGSDVIAGVIYDPVMNELFFAEKGNGAFLNNRRLRMKTVHDLDNALIACHGMGSGLIDRLVAKGSFIRKTGSTALNLAYVASGRFDGFVCLADAKEWDFAAGVLIATESGAAMRSDRPDILKSAAIVVAAIDIVEDLSSIIAA